VSGLLVACATPSVNTSVLMPAKQSGMLDSKRVGIASLEGDHNGIMSDRLRSFIADIRVEGNPYFILIDLDRQAVLGEQRFADSSMFSTDTAIELGNLTSADTLLGGSFSSNYDRTSTQKEEVYCSLEYEDKCVYYKTKKVNCHEQNSSAELNLRATNVEMGTISFTQSYNSSSEHSWCDDLPDWLGGEAKEKAKMQNEDIGKILAQLRQDIAPFVVSYKIRFMKKDKSYFGGIREVKSLFKSALEFAEGERVVRGCELFRSAASQYEKSPAIYHNVGVCAEIEGDFDQALAFYQKADRLTRSPSDIIGDSLSRVEKTIAERSVLKDQLR
jgi:tetratricopeptide (TPR) repeat protein